MRQDPSQIRRAPAWHDADGGTGPGSGGAVADVGPPPPGWSDSGYHTPRLDEPAPPFFARTTQGVRSLSDYRGQWLMLFAHPADFTPVCTSEFVALQRRADAFDQRGCALLGLSVDSVFAHLAWVRSIKESFGVEIQFPIIEDVSMAIAANYGMIHPGSTSTATIRSVFFIDPEGVLRVMLHYPMTVGRSVDELLRVLDALQTTHSTDLATPEGWTPGDRLVEAPPLTVSEALAREGKGAAAWYYSENDQ